MTLEDGRKTSDPTSDDDTTVVDFPVVPEPRQTPPRFVDLGDGRMGLQTDVFNLAGMFDVDADDDFRGSGRANQVYFRTKSGNIYWLDQHGRLINRNLSLRQQKAQIVNLDPFELGESEDLLVGHVFTYGQDSTLNGLPHTTPITEIIATSDLMHASSSVTMGRRSGIVRDFLQGLPAIPAPGEQV